MAGPLGNIHELLQCPYVLSHVVGASRFQTHLVRCREQNPEVAKLISICSYNQTHHIKSNEMSAHLMVCQDYLANQMHTSARERALAQAGTRNITEAERKQKKKQCFMNPVDEDEEDNWG